MFKSAFRFTVWNLLSFVLCLHCSYYKTRNAVQARLRVRYVNLEKTRPKMVLRHSKDKNDFKCTTEAQNICANTG